MATIKITNQAQFNETLRKYVLYTKRSIPTIVNTKSFYIARRASIETPRAKLEEMRKFVSSQDGAIIGKMINKRRGARGEKGLYGAAMEKEVALVYAARRRARGFLASGWLWAIRMLAPYAEKIGSFSSSMGAKTYGKPKGKAIPAIQGWRVSAKIINTVAAAWDKREGALAKADPALQKAFDAERQSMLDYINKHLTTGAQLLGIKYN